MIEIRQLEACAFPTTAPETLSDNEGYVDYNHPMDEKALRILADAYPGRRVIGVDARELSARGGGIHCITQQQPSAI